MPGGVRPRVVWSQGEAVIRGIGISFSFRQLVDVYPCNLWRGFPANFTILFVSMPSLPEFLPPGCSCCLPVLQTGL